jgi:hypothetical protein
MAQLETSQENWRNRDVQKLIEDCRIARDAHAVENEGVRSGYSQPAGSAA